jgi:peptide/nickel transport system substrate-binding protein
MNNAQDKVQDESHTASHTASHTEAVQAHNPRLAQAVTHVQAGRVSRRNFLVYAALLGVSATTASALAACAPTTPVAPAADATMAPAAEAAMTGAPSGTLRVAWEIPVQLDPALASSDSEISIISSVYDYLVDIDSGSNIQPRLATDWTVSEDGLTYTFTLAEGVTFHDGSPLTAEDVVWTFNRLRDPESGFPTADLYANIADVSATDAGEVQFTLTQTNPFFLYDLSDNHAVVVQAEATDLGTTFNGTGPFMVADYSPENRMDLTANPNYFIEGKPGVEALELVFFGDQAAAVDALRGGQVDIVLRMPTPLYLSLEGDPDITPVNTPTNGFDLVRLRSDRPPGNDPRVIQAMKLATDRDAIFDTVTLALGAVGRDSPIGPLFSAYFDPSVPIPPRDPEAARALLAEAGYPDGLELDLHVPDSGDRPDLAVVLQEQWAEAGINVNVIVEPESVYYGDNGWLEVDLGITGWGSRPTPQFYLDVMLVSDAVWNESHFSDEEFDRLAEIAGTTLDEAERIAAYQEIQRILIERGPIVIPYFFPALGAVRNSFTGFELQAFPGRTDLAAVRPAS